MSKDQQDAVRKDILAVLEVVSKVHERSGRHELNRTDLEIAIAELRAGGTAAVQPDMQKLL